MKCYIEVISNNAATRQIVLRLIRRLPNLPIQWHVWSHPEFVNMPLPQLSLVDISSMSHDDVAISVSHCMGEKIALWGGLTSDYPMPVLPMNFSTHDLLSVSLGLSDRDSNHPGFEEEWSAYVHTTPMEM